MLYLLYNFFILGAFWVCHVPSHGIVVRAGILSNHLIFKRRCLTSSHKMRGFRFSSQHVLLLFQKVQPATQRRDSRFSSQHFLVNVSESSIRFIAATPKMPLMFKIEDSHRHHRIYYPNGQFLRICFSEIGRSFGVGGA